MLRNIVGWGEMFYEKCQWIAKKLSTVAGTQCLDRSWLALKEFLPKTLAVKRRQDGHSKLHQSCPDYVFSWAWRQSLTYQGPEDFLNKLQKLLRGQKSADKFEGTEGFATCVHSTSGFKKTSSFRNPDLRLSKPEL